MKVAVYARVSTDEAAEKQTIGSQLHECRLYAERNGLEIVEEFTDEGVSGTLPFEERLGGRRLLEAAQAKQFDRTVIYCVDRLGRDVGEGIDAYRKLAKLSVPVEFVLQSIDGTPEGELQFNMFLSFAQYELSSIRRRTMQGRARKVREGQYMCAMVAWGYDRVDGQLVVNEEQAATIRRIFHLAAYEGMGLNSIAKLLNREGIAVSRRPGRYGASPTTIGKILAAHRYTGNATYAGEPMSCPAIVDEATFQAARKALAKRKSDSLRNTQRPYLLQHLLYCGHCGSRYLSKTTSAGAVYLCSARTVHGKEAGHEGIKWRWRAEEIEGRIQAMIRQFVSDPAEAVKTIELYAEQIGHVASELEDKAAPLRAKLEDLAAQEARCLDWGRRGVLSERDMLSQLTAVRSEQEDITARLKELEAVKVDPGAVLAAISDGWKEIVQAVREFQEAAAAKGVDVEVAWQEWSPEEWHKAVRYFCDRIVVEDDGSLRVEGIIATPSLG